MNKKSLPAKAFLIALTLSLIPVISPWYCEIFLKDTSFVVKRFNDFFTKKDTNNLYQYNIPLKEITSGKTHLNSISLGIIRPLASISCGRSMSTVKQIAELQKVNFSNTPITLDLDQFPPCRDYIRVEIKTNTTIGPQHSGVVLLGSKEHVKAVSEITTLFSDRIRIILTFVVIFVLFVNSRNKSLGLNTQPAGELNPNLTLWTLFLGLSSGVFTTVFPIQITPEQFLLALYTVSALCHLGPIVSYLVPPKHQRTTFPIIMCAIVFPVISLSNGGVVYSIIGISLSIVAIIKVAVKREHSSSISFYSIALLVNFLKILLPPSSASAYLPHWHFASVFIGVYLILKTMRELRVNGVMFKSLAFIHKEMKKQDEQIDIENSLNGLCSSLNCVKASLLIINHDNSCSVYTYDRKSEKKSNFNIVTINTLPPIFSHIITTRKTIRHLREDSPLASRLRKKQNQEALGHTIFTAAPIYKDGSELGAIACTGYEIDLSDHQLVEAFDSAFQVFLGYFAGIAEGKVNSGRIDANKEIELTLKKINEIKSTLDLEKIRASMESFGKILSCKGFWGTIDEKSNRINIQATLNLSEIEKEPLFNLPLKGDTSNEHGPIPLAIKTERPSYINEVSLIKGLLSEGSVAFLERTLARSLAVIPFKFGSESEEVKSILYLSSEAPGAFDSFAQSASERYMNTLQSRLQHLFLHKNFNIANSMLAESRSKISSFIPKHLVDDFLSGKEVSEPDYGYLLMFDVKGSTNLSNTISNSDFHAQMGTLRDSLIPPLLSEKWILRQYLWDSMEFTHTSAETENREIIVQSWLEKIEPIFDHWKNELLLKYGNLPQIQALSFRLCFTYGDTTRGIVVEGDTQKWSFTGNAIAVVSKVEQAAKKLNGKVFCDQSMLKKSKDKWIELSTTNQGLVIFGLKEAAVKKTKAAA